jgi:hypothetical protein
MSEQSTPPAIPPPLRPTIPEGTEWSCAACTALNPLVVGVYACSVCETLNNEAVDQLLAIIDPEGLLKAPPPTINPPPEKIVKIADLPPPEECKEFPFHVFDVEYRRRYYRHFLTLNVPSGLEFPPDLIRFVVHYIADGYEKGDIVEARDKFNKWYTAEILDIAEGKVFIHYQGWPSKWDEWIPNSESGDRLAPVLTNTNGQPFSKPPLVPAAPVAQVPQAVPTPVTADPEHIATIMALGFEAEQAIEVLEEFNNDVEQAMNALLDNQ